MKTSLSARPRLFGLAFLLSAAVILLGNAVTIVVIGGRISGFEYLTVVDVVVTFVTQLFFTGLPFFALAGCGEQRRTFWLTAVALTLVSWTYAVWQMWHDSLTGFAGGANIGLGLIMMAAPIVIAVVLTAASLVSKPPAA